MKKQISVMLLFLVLMTLLSACTEKTSLIDTKWQLTNLAGNPPLADVKVTLNFSSDAIGGNDGCNTYGGSYKATKNSLAIGNDVFSTMMYCTDEIAKQYQAFYEALKQTASYKTTDNNLSLLDSKGTVLAVFEAIKN
jgi:heat shock protein HslJ